MAESKLAWSAVVAKTMTTDAPVAPPTRVAVPTKKPAWGVEKKSNKVAGEDGNLKSKGVSESAAALPTKKQDDAQVSKDNGSNFRKVSEKESSPTPAETVKRQEKQKDQHNNVGEGAKHGSKQVEERPDGSDKKGSWKKLDVDLSFNKECRTSDGEASRSGVQGKKRSGGNKKGVERKNEDTTKKVGKGKQRNNTVGQGARSRDESKKADGAEKVRTSKSKKNRPPRGRKQAKANMYKECQPLSPADFEALKAGVVRQVEYFFSDDELCRNTFLRRHMDVDGYVPAAIIFNFPSVAAYCFPYYDLIAAISEKASRIEVDEANDTLRLKDGYAKWLCPNGEGGFGCAKWVKQQEQHQEQAVDGSTTVAVSSGDSMTLDKGDIVGVNGGKVPSSRSDDSSNGSLVTPETASCTDSETEPTDADSR